MRCFFMEQVLIYAQTLLNFHQEVKYLIIVRTRPLPPVNIFISYNGCSILRIFSFDKWDWEWCESDRITLQLSDKKCKFSKILKTSRVISNIYIIVQYNVRDDAEPCSLHEKRQNLKSNRTKHVSNAYTL